MPSTYSTDLKLELMVTGEKAGLWGNITNTNLNILQQAIGGYEAIPLNATTGVTLTFSNGTTSDGKNAVLDLTGTITTSVNVIIPDGIEKTYIIRNSTSGAHDVVVKTVSGTGATFSTTDKGTKLLYSDGTDVVDTGLTAGITAVVQDTSPQLGGMLDVNTFGLGDGTLQLLNFTETASAVNEFTITNNATGSAPILSATGDDSNIGITLTPKGTGVVDVTGTLLADKAYLAETTLTDGATIDWDMATQAVSAVTLGGNRTLNAPANGSTGQFASLLVIQDGTGGRTITWNAIYEFAADTAPTLTATASLGDVFTFRYNGTKWLEVGRNLALTLS